MMALCSSCESPGEGVIQATVKVHLTMTDDGWALAFDSPPADAMAVELYCENDHEESEVLNSADLIADYVHTAADYVNMLLAKGGAPIAQ